MSRGNGCPRCLERCSLLYLMIGGAFVASLIAWPQKNFAAEKISKAQEKSATTNGASEKPSGTHLSASELATILRDSNAKYKGVKVVGAGPDVTVLADTPSTATEQDLKIDAIFLSKALVDAAPAQIDKVKVLFAQHGPDGKFIIIPKKSILDYGSGKIAPNAFLGTLHLEDVKPEETPAVEPGPQAERRLLIWERIEKLRAAGTGVEPFEQLFDDAETTVKNGGTTYALSRKLSYIESKLAEQEEQVAQAKKTATGHGISPVQGKSWQSSGSSQAGGKRARLFEELIATPKGKEFVRNMYNKYSQGLISKIMPNNPAKPRLVSIKQEIDSDFSKGREADGLNRVRDFFREVRLAGGGDMMQQLLNSPESQALESDGAAGGPPSSGGVPSLAGPLLPSPGQGMRGNNQQGGPPTSRNFPRRHLRVGQQPDSIPPLGVPGGNGGAQGNR